MCVLLFIGVCTCHCSVNSLIMKPFCVPRPQVNWQFWEHMYPIYMSTPLLDRVQKVNGAFILGRSEFAKNTFGVFSGVPTCLADSGLMRYVTSAVSIPTDLMPTACQRGKNWIIFSPTSCVTIWSRTCMFLARRSRAICLAYILTSQIRPTMVKRVSFSVTTLLRLIFGCISFVTTRS